MCYIYYIERYGDITMDSIRRLRNFLSILMLYASDLIIRDNKTADNNRIPDNKILRITGRVLPRLTTDLKKM